ncbi:MAG: hypothetical protein ABFR62_09225, partial [Bacteroidota bacterium]
MHKLTLFFSIILVSLSGVAQNNMLQLGDTARAEYPYIFPILGDKAHEQGFDLPLPAGIMVNYFYAVQDIAIPDIAVGFNDGILPEIPLTDITRLIEFEEVRATAYTVNVRPDLWVLPFLNVYGIFGKTWSQSNVKISYPFTLNTVAKLEGASYGLGVTGASGIGKYFFVLDGNWVWTMLTNFEEPVKSRVFSFRLGRAFPVGKNEKSNVAFWVGGMRVRMGGITEGTITLGEVIPEEGWNRRDEIVDEYYIWYDNADPLKQAAADKVLTPIVESIGAANGDGIVHYKITKKPVQEWNMIIGGQYQINKVWQLRAEGGVIGNRKSFLFSVN